MGALDTAYAQSCYGILKILEFICLLVCWACIIDVTSGYGRHSRTSFLLGVSISAWIFVIIFFCCYLFMLCGHFSFNNKGLIFAICHFIWFVLLLISGALAADYIASYRRCRTSYCDIYKVSCAFGLFSALLFLIDGVYHFKNQGGVTHSSSSSSGGTRTVTKTTVVTTR